MHQEADRRFLPLKDRVLKDATGNDQLDQLTKDFILAGQGKRMRWEFNKRTFEGADGLSMKEMRAIFEKEMDKNGEELFSIAQKSLKGDELKKLPNTAEDFLTAIKKNFEITMGDI